MQNRICKLKEDPRDGWDCHFSCAGDNSDPFDCKPKGFKDVKNGDWKDRLDTFAVCYTLYRLSEQEYAKKLKLNYFHDQLCDLHLFYGMCWEGSSRDECINPKDFITELKCKAFVELEDLYSNIMDEQTKIKKDARKYQKNRNKIINQSDIFTDDDI